MVISTVAVMDMLEGPKMTTPEMTLGIGGVSDVTGLHRDWHCRLAVTDLKGLVVLPVDCTC